MALASILEVLPPLLATGTHESGVWGVSVRAITSEDLGVEVFYRKSRGQGPVQSGRGPVQSRQVLNGTVQGAVGIHSPPEVEQSYNLRAPGRI